MTIIEEKRKAFLEQKLKEMADMGVTKRAPEDYPSSDQPFQVLSTLEVEDQKPQQKEQGQEKDEVESRSGAVETTPSVQAVTEVETQPETTVSMGRKTKSVQKKDFAEYQQRFLMPVVLQNRTQFAMNKETIEQLRHIVQDLDIRTTISAYIENILRDHISEYRDLINQVTAKRRRRETIPE